jgi:hypothetical protein
MGITEEGGKVASNAVEAMKGTPLGIALLVVNLAFIAFVAYILGEVAENTRTIDRQQMEMIGKLVTDIRDCRQPGGQRLGTLEHLLPPK